MKLLMVAPFDANGRYKGGIFAIANDVIHAEDELRKNELEILPFNTCRVQREAGSDGKLNISNLKNLFKVYFDLPKEIKSNSPDVLYFHTSRGIPLVKDLIILNRAKKKTGVKTVLHIHFADYEKIMTGKSFFDMFILRSLKKNVDKIVFLSSKTRDAFVEHGIESEKCNVIYNFSTLQFTNEEIQTKLDRQGALRFLFVGSVDQRKGLFDVLEILKDSDRNFEITVCGGVGTEEDRVRFEEYQKAYGEKLNFLGYVSGEEKRRVFLESDVLLLPSYGEGLPIVIVEALTAGCAVLTSDVGAIPEIVTEKNGTVITAGNKEQIRNGLAFYLQEDRSVLREQQKFNFENSGVYSLEMFIKHMADACK